MASIFSTADWVSGKNYKKDDIVIYVIGSVKKYFYSLQSHLSSAGNSPSYTSSFWGGYAQDSITGASTPKIRPYFLWRASYNLVVNSSPKVSVVKFSDGYEQRIVDGVFNLLLSADVTFEGRDEKEAAAILHFFSVLKGRDPFIGTLPHPYDSPKLYVCREWSCNYVFYNNYSIKASFDEVTG